MKRLAWYDRILSFLLLATVVAPAPALAQTGIQVQYVRPAKGAAFNVITNATALTTSPVYDMTAFESVIVSTACASTCNIGTTVSVSVVGASTVGGQYQAFGEPTADCTATGASGAAYCTFSNLPPFVKFSVTPGGGSGITVTVVPVPFGIRKEVSGSRTVWGTVTPNTDKPVIVGGLSKNGDVVGHLIIPDNLGQAVQGSGTAGTPAGGVLTVQGVSGGTGFPATPDVVTTGNITTGGADCSVATNCVVSAALSGVGAGSVLITGTWTGTLNFEGSVDGTTWFSDTALQDNGPLITGTTVNLTASFGLGGLTKWRVRSTGATTGTAAITIRASTAAPHTVFAVATGDVAAGSADSGSPVKQGLVGKANDPVAVSDGQRANQIGNLFGEARTAVPTCAGVTVNLATTSASATATVVAGTFYEITVRGAGAQCIWGATATTTTGKWWAEGLDKYERATGTSLSCLTTAAGAAGNVFATPCSY